MLQVACHRQHASTAHRTVDTSPALLAPKKLELLTDKDHQNVERSPRIEQKNRNDDKHSERDYSNGLKATSNQQSFLAGVETTYLTHLT